MTAIVTALGSPPDDAGVMAELGPAGGVRSWDNGDMQEGYEVTIAELPPDVKVVRFVMSH